MTSLSPQEKVKRKRRVARHEEVMNMPLWRLLAAEISKLIEKNEDPEQAVDLIQETLRKYRRHEIFWPGAGHEHEARQTSEDEGHSRSIECEERLAGTPVKDEPADIHTLSSEDFGVDWLTGKYTDRRGRLKRELQRLNSRGYSLYD